jgi:hypothetical protein
LASARVDASQGGDVEKVLVAPGRGFHFSSTENVLTT